MKQTVKGKGEKMGYNAIEVKVKTNVMAAWENILPVIMFQHELPTIKRFLAQIHGSCEIRWNFVGSSQGHYESAMYGSYDNL